MGAYRLVAVAAMVGLAGTLRGDAFQDKVSLLYRPFLAEQVALSPDGRHVAYTQHEGGELSVVTMEIENPSAKWKLVVEGDRQVIFSKERDAARLRYLRGITPTRVVFSPTEETIPRGPDQRERYSARLYAADADGKNAQLLADERDFKYTVIKPVEEGPPDFTDVWRRTNVLGQMPGDDAHVWVEALGTFALSRELAPVPTQLYKVNIVTGKVSLVSEDTLLGRYLYDWQGRPRLISVQPLNTNVRTFMYHPPATMSRWAEMDAKWSEGVLHNFVLSPQSYFQERSFPLSFDFGGNVLLFASNVGRDTYGIYGFDVATKLRTKLAIEHPHFDLAPLEPSFPTSHLVFDEHRQQLAGVRATGVTPMTVWEDAELAAVQRELEVKFPRRIVEILEWNEARTRFLLRVWGGADPGRHVVYQRPENLLVEFLRRAPWLNNADLHESRPFEFDTPGGVHLTGYLTLPRKSRINPPPLLLLFPAGFPARAAPDFDPEAQILAGMGFVVMKLNHRGAVGFGTKHRDAIQAGVDRVPLDDARAAIEWVVKRHPIDRRRIATMGEGFGGYLALRALQLHPDLFRCAVGVNAPLDLERWSKTPIEDIEAVDLVAPDFAQEARRIFFERTATRLADASVLRHAEQLTRPVFLVLDPSANNDITAQTDSLRSRLRRADPPPEYVAVKSDFALKLPAARARVYRQMEEFFNANLYNYRVKVGETREVP